MKKLILMLGSAFDPPHNGHMMMAHEVVRVGIADKVVFVPCGNHPFAKEMSNSIHRYKMTKSVVETLVRQDGSFFDLSDIEVARNGLSYAWDTLEEIAKKHPNNQVGWLMGSDQLPSFNQWYRYREILAKYPVYVYPRKDCSFELLYPEMIKIENVPVVDISSSDIRVVHAREGDIGSMVLPDVAKYMQEHNLWTK